MPLQPGFAQTAGVVLQGLPVNFFSSGELGNDEDDRSLRLARTRLSLSARCRRHSGNGMTTAEEIERAVGDVRSTLSRLSCASP
jgi:hypothetical protein